MNTPPYIIFFFGLAASLAAGAVTAKAAQTHRGRFKQFKRIGSK